VSATLTIERLGHRGDGIAAGPVFVPYTLPGETVEAEVLGERGRLLAVTGPSPERTEPFCPYFGVCGGCAIQHWEVEHYRAWKRGLLVEALAQAGLDWPVEALVDAHGAGRRRATFHARAGVVGFAKARSHRIVDIALCPILEPALDKALPAARAVARALSSLGKPIDLLATSTETGIDLDIRGAGKVDEGMRRRLAPLAGEQDLARLSVHGDIVIARRMPAVRIGRALVEPPPGAFLQATAAADAALAALVLDGAGTSRRVADLFSGCGTFSLLLAERATVSAFDSDRPALDALHKAARRAEGLKPVTSAERDLFRRPLQPEELKSFDAVVYDPPRAGAELQSRRLAASTVKRVVAVSCNAQTFARDAAILAAGGYRPTRITPVDQFRHSAHLEIVAAFER
jgi:23S rRNA (uracil1939-C5)-methyltransferase